MRIIDSYKHDVASHCETGTMRNLLNWAGCDVKEPMVFGTGSGPAFFYLFFVKGPSGFPLVATRTPPGTVQKNLVKLWNLSVFTNKYKTTDEAIAKANALLDEGIPVAVTVDMFYMTYLPSFLHVHAPFHFIVLVGRQGDTYAVSDPYFDRVGELKESDLRAAWATHAPMAKDNYLCYVESVPDNIDYKSSAIKAIKKTCDNMLMPPVIGKIFWFMGIEGMKAYAKRIRTWPDHYRGTFLREGILFNAVGFEDQGTGGGAFRLIYGAFLQEVVEMTGSSALKDLAESVIDHGQKWRDISRMFIRIGKKIPIEDDAYEDWATSHLSELRTDLTEASQLFLERAEFEKQFFKDLKKVASDL